MKRNLNVIATGSFDPIIFDIRAFSPIFEVRLDKNTVRKCPAFVRFWGSKSI